MKKYAIISAVALTASIALAGSAVNLKKVNKVIRHAIQPALTETIRNVGIEIDEHSNMESIETLDTSILFSATAKNSKWSQKKTTLEATAGVKTLTTDATNTTLEAHATIGSSTEAVPLYVYAAQAYVQHMEQFPDNSESAQLLLAIMKDAAQTKSLNAVPAQLTRIVDLLKKEASEESGAHDDWAELVNGLKIESKVQGSNTVGVSVQMTSPVTLSYLTLSKLAFNMSNDGLSINAQFSFNVETQNVANTMNGILDFLKTIETATPETIDQLQYMAKNYVQLAESFVKGEGY
jgi:hypothetical protein